MAEYQAGLHKEVASIFNGVWDPEVDNIEQSFTPTGTNDVVYHMGHSPRSRRGEPNPTIITRTRSEAPTRVSSFRLRRREKKRLRSISKHLIINNSAD